MEPFVHLESLLRENIVMRGMAPLHACREALAYMIVVEGGDVESIPDATCVARHLPTDRDPTFEDIKAALAACRTEMGK